jgi:protein-S-isoprenylcysteine O-methyltransferase Ste14
MALNASPAVDKRISFWGVGPRIGAPSLIYTLGAWAATSTWPGIFQLRWLPGGVRIAGAALLLAGLLIYFAGAVTVMRAYKQDRLVTSGVFGLVRHPVYAGWISLALPGLALFVGSWPMLLTPLMAYAIFKRLIRREEDYLAQRFGQEYLDYRRRVNGVIPIPRWWGKASHAPRRRSR